MLKLSSKKKKVKTTSKTETGQTPDKIEISPQLSKQIGEQTGAAAPIKRGLYRIKVHTRDPLEFDKEKVHKVSHVAVTATSPEAAMDKVKKHYKSKKSSHVRAYHMKTVSEGMTAQDLKARLDHHSMKAMKANKAGDDAKVIHHLKAINKLKFKIERLVKEERVDLEEAVLNIQQRIKRAQIFRKNQPKIQRMRQIARNRMAQEKQLHRRAFVLARKIVRKRVAGNRGVEYANLSPSDKISVDTMVDRKVKLIKVLAGRLVPRVKQAEIARLRHVRQGTSTKAAHGPLVMDFNKEFETFLNESGLEVKGKESTLKKKKKVPGIIDRYEWNKLHNQFEVEDDNELIEVVASFLDDLKRKYAINETLQKKASKVGIPYETLKEVFQRGCNSWSDDKAKSQEQYGFDRVNSFIAGGKARELDGDLNV